MRRNIILVCFTCLILLQCLLSGCMGKPAVEPYPPSTAGKAETHIITDMAKREVEIPLDVKTVYSTGQPGVVMMYTLCPDKLLGWCIKLSDEERKYINPKYLSLPVIGIMQGSKGTANKEEIIGRKPDIIILMTLIDKDAVETADKIQSTMDIPVVVLDYSLKNLDKSYLFLGEILNEAKRAEILAKYCKETVEEAMSIARTIPDNEILSVYYAQGSNGLQTAPAGSSHSEVIDLVNGRNVVKLRAESDGRLGVSIEQLLLWNPDAIITSYSAGHTGNGMDDTGVSSIIKNGSETWKLVRSVRDNMVFSTPCYPFNWLDMPPSSNRMIGIKWMGNLLYPHYYSYDIKAETRKFYSLFYDVKLTDMQLDALLNNAARIR